MCICSNLQIVFFTVYADINVHIILYMFVGCIVIHIKIKKKYANLSFLKVIVAENFVNNKITYEIFFSVGEVWWKGEDPEENMRRSKNELGWSEKRALYRFRKSTSAGSPDF